VLLQVAAAMKAGLAVTVAPHHLTLSTQEAADLLRISRTTLVRLLETGAIPFEKPSRHRKVRLHGLQACTDAMTWLAWYAPGIFTAVMDYMDHVDGALAPVVHVARPRRPSPRAHVDRGARGFGIRLPDARAWSRRGP
jgi:excisionase family DNA binding protein